MSSFQYVPLDFETTYGDDYTLSKMTAEEYIRDPRFEIIGLALRWPGQQTRWLSMPQAELIRGLKRLDWSNKIVIGHNMSEFDSLILTEICGVKPRFYQCTLAMARAVLGTTQSKSLAALCKLFNLPDKGDEVVRAKGKRRLDFSPQELAAYGRYCIGDTDRCWEIYQILCPLVLPREREYLHLLIRMWAEPRLALDGPLLTQLGAEVSARKDALLHDVVSMIDTGGVYTRDHAQKLLRSDAKFAHALQMFGVDPPMKFSKKKKNADGSPMAVYAFAKTDEGMEELLNDEDERVQVLAAARLGVKTTIEESRILRFSGIAARGLLPAPIAYGKTQTDRAAGCLVASTKIICYDPLRGKREKAIVDVQLDDLVWDGEEFVAHEGVKFSGYQDVIEHDGITGTACHPVFCTEGSDETLRLDQAKSAGARIVAPREPQAGVDYGVKPGEEGR